MNKIWWKEQVIYQIYPRSFKDSNGDGIGDLRGIISKLDYLQDLGVDIIWLNPIYESPNDDNGYDISNYYKIHPEFGIMDDFDELLEGLHDRDMKLLMDLVVNHSSDEHEWFEESKKSKDNPYRDYYFWKPGKDGGPPNNWKSFFGGSAWEYDETTDEYYLHLFTKKQPDLNWENPKVRQGVYEIVRFWLDKGVDGFRMDVIPLISKRLAFEDTPYEDFGDTIEKIYSNGPKVHEYINEMYENALKDYDSMTVGEGPGINKDVALLYVGEDRNELNMIFHLDHMFLGFGPKGRFDPTPYSLKDIKIIFNNWYVSMGETGWVSIFLDNHDFPRLVSRFGNDKEYRNESAKLLAMLILTMRGTACIYHGSEIGMTNVEYDSINDFDDVEIHNFYKEYTAEGMAEAEFIALANEYGRDNVRTPFHWDGSKHAGFTSGAPWIKVNTNYPDINLENVLNDPNSIFYFYKHMLQLRKEHDTLVYGAFKEISDIEDQLYIYERWDDEKTYLVCLNFSDDHREIQLDMDQNPELLISNYDENDPKGLKPWEARLYMIE